MTENMGPRERYIEGLKTISLDELLDELEHSSKKLGQYDIFSDHWNVAVEEIKIIRAEFTRRFDDN